MAEKPVADDLWFAWLVKKSVFKLHPAIVYLIAYLLGIIIWRLSQIRWQWWSRELKLLPYGFLVILIAYWLLKIYWWRFVRVLLTRPKYLLICLIIFIVGYFYADLQWQKTDFDRHFSLADVYEESQLLLHGRLIEYTDLGDSVRCYIQLLKTNNKISDKRIIINQPSFTGDIRLGDLVLVRGNVKPFPKATNPGEFDFQRFHRYHLVLGQVWRGEIQLLARPKYSLHRWLGQGRTLLLKFFSRRLSDDSWPLLSSLLTGDDSYLPLNDLEKIRDLGLSHLLAVSGLHLGLVSGLVKELLKIFKIPHLFRPIILLLLIWFLVLFVGGKPSALRVGLFLTLVQIGQLIQRPINTWNLLAITAGIILLKNPLTLFLLSFQLSFVVYLSIILFSKPLTTLLNSLLPTSRFFMKISKFIALSIAAFLGSLPLILFNFFQVPFLGILMNLWAVPLISILLSLGIIALLIGLIMPGVATPIIFLLDHFIKLFHSFTDFFSCRFSLVWQPGRPPILGIIIFYLSLGLIWKIFSRQGQPLLWYAEEKRLVKIFFLIVIPLYFVFHYFLLINPEFEWVMLDVGQGDSMFLQLPDGIKILVDGGGRPGRPNKTGERIVKPFLLSRGISELDLICVTHFDADHVQGILTILDDLKVKQIWAPPGGENKYAQYLQKLAQIKKISLKYPQRGQKICLDKTLIEVLHPVKGVVYGDENQKSLVLRISCGGRKLLFMGDLGEKGEAQLVNADWELKADILKIGHHGSKYSSTTAFLEEVDPEIALISVGGNTYGHPAEETLARLKAIGCHTLRTDEVGAISVKLTGSKKIIIQGYK